MKAKKPKILFWDIETTPLLAYIWRPGKQVVRHPQLKKGSDMWNIICITYCWNDGKPAKALIWEKGSCKKLIKEFDKIVQQADISIGKNSDRFDVKHINVQRMLTQDYGLPDWAAHTDDLEKQIRKHFALPSFSLDYLSELLGFGGKIKMQMQDWIDIVENNDNAEKSLKKMVKYGKKDVIDTRALWNRLSKHFRPKLNMATFAGDHVCTNCGSSKIRKNGTRTCGKTRKQSWFCTAHGGFAGYTTLPFKYKNPSDPKLGG